MKYGAINDLVVTFCGELATEDTRCGHNSRYGGRNWQNTKGLDAYWFLELYDPPPLRINMG